MKRFLALAAVGFALFTLGCGHVDLTPESDPDRVLTGTVNVHMDLLPPPDAEVVVRLVELPDVTAASTRAQKDVVIGDNGTRERPESVVAETVIHAPATLPIPFRLEYHASDALLRRGLNVEARISWGKQLRFRTLDAQVVTLATANTPLTVWAEPLR
jgi:uncharacterized lipoprotein YbaY